MNFADDNTVSAAERTIENVIFIFEKEGQAAIVVVKKNAKLKDSYPQNINDLAINSENSLKLLGIEIDNKLPYSNTFLPSVIKQATN